jgi:hypothetical protein
MTIFHVHNLAMGDLVPPPPQAGTGGVPPARGVPIGGVQRRSALRDDIVKKLADGGWQRPPHAPGVRRAR